MNFLAHIYLSGHDELVTIGNFMADSIKGKAYKTYPKVVQTGILLHRQIDTFTDTHKTFKQSTKRLHPKYSHYSGVIVDIFYDHFLAKNWNLYCEKTLKNYVAEFYSTLEKHSDILPDKVQKMLPHMIADNWLLNYASTDGISRVLTGMNRRTQNRSGMHQAVVELDLYYEEFESEFSSFFIELIDFSKSKLKELHPL